VRHDDSRLIKCSDIGLTAEQCEVEGACQLCLKEIDVGRPFFLGLLGTRYGWIPPTYGITTEEKSFDWIRDLPVTRSITELEILHGFLWPHKRPDGSDGPQPAHVRFDRVELLL